MEAKCIDYRAEPSKLDRGETETGRFSIPEEKRKFPVESASGREYFFRRGSSNEQLEHPMKN